jgi:hypothetical protein
VDLPAGAPAPESIARYRARYRSEEIGRAYRGRLHLAFTRAVSIGVILLCIWQLDAVTALEWLTVPLALLYANLAEYVGHRGPMHRPVRGLKLVYERHAKQHHRFFTDRAMAFESSRDFKAVLFPPLMIVFFIGGFGLPLWILLYILASANVAWLALATAVAYFLNYEWLHFAYHCDPRSRIGRIPGLAVLRRLHVRHHDPRLMTRYNFNITYPVGDWLFRTLHHSGPDSPA